MCKDAYTLAIWTLLVVSALVGAYQIYNIAINPQLAPQAILLLAYVAYAMPIVALVLYAIKQVRWLSAVAAALAVALANSIPMATFLILYIYGTVSGKEQRH